VGGQNEISPFEDQFKSLLLDPPARKDRAGCCQGCRGVPRRSVTESQNHRTVGVGRALCGSSSPTLLLKQGHLRRLHRTLSVTKAVLVNEKQRTEAGNSRCKIPQLAMLFETGGSLFFDSFHSCLHSAAPCCRTHFLCPSRRRHLP